MITIVMASGMYQGASDAVSMAFPLSQGRREGIIQADGIDSEQVQIQGRLEGSMNWVTILTLTGASVLIQSVLLLPEMRLNMVGLNYGNGVNARIGA